MTTILFHWMPLTLSVCMCVCVYVCVCEAMQDYFTQTFSKAESRKGCLKMFPQRLMT